MPEERELFAWETIDTVELSYHAGRADYMTRVREVVLSRTIPEFMDAHF